MGTKLSDGTIKRILLIGSGFALGYCLYRAYKTWRKRQSKNIDEGFEDVSKIEETPEKRILFLGLESAGKSTLISQISTGSAVASKNMEPTEGFKVTPMETNGICLKIWEIGGMDKVRSYWTNFLQDTDILVFVVDAANFHNLSRAVKEIKWLLADERLANVPVLLVANKQDIESAMNPQQVANALDLGSVPPSKHKVHIIGTQCPPNAVLRHPSISELEKVLLATKND
ncbi:UNVERIFIED_CONTAM: hypothetical protein PYX00_006974 [Menopon gallinae]|uniref:ADP-ribosylation factor-like protein 3 n=1 Tax=Menopon gallinae TaxID=328185 RepID=A0AAW2HHW8_9NEOP